MKVLVLGATGATGRLVVQQLIKRSVEVKIVVRRVTDELKEMVSNSQLECIIGNISEFEEKDFLNIIEDCDAVVSCLGHNISFKGIFGKPRMLVFNCIKNIVRSIAKNKKKEPIKLILMSTTAFMNKKGNEKFLLGDRLVLFLLKFILPPHLDNLKAATYLSEKVGYKNSLVEWVAVRPDALINEEKISDYEVFNSPKYNPVSNSGKTSRINAGHFMVELLTEDNLWEEWKYKMPVIYNSEK